MSEELRKKIVDTATEMGYSAISRNVQNGASSSIGVLIPAKFINPNGSFYWALYNCLVTRLKKDNIMCIMENLEQEDEDNLVMPNLVSGQKLAGVISLGQLSDGYVKELHQKTSTLILLDYYCSAEKIDSIVTNGFSGGYKLCSYLIKNGHRKIGYIGNKFATTSIFDRYMGYLKAMIENGLEAREEWLVDDRDKRDFIQMTFPEEDMPTAFVCNCDEAAYHAIRQLKAIGYNVPRDISIVGYDNYLISEISNPPITTVNVDAEYMADVAVDVLLGRISNPNTPTRTVTIEGDLVVKESVNSI